MFGIRSFRNNLIGKCILSLFGVGFSPFAPGTAGSLLSLFLFFELNKFLPADVVSRGIVLVLSFVIVFFISAYWIRICTSQENHDEQWIVVDEFLGMMISVSPLFFLKGDWYWWLIAFGLFRFFDIIKPLGIKKIDRGKNFLSVLWDDVVAGIYAVVIFIVLFFDSSFFLS